MPFADVFSGFEGAASDHYSKLLEMQYGQRRDAAAAIAKMADDPRFDEQSQMALKHRALDIIGGDPMKPLSSKDLDVSSILVRPPAPPPTLMPGGQGAQNMPIAQQLSGQETAGGPVPQASPNTGPTGQMPSQTIQAPAPPPHPADQMMSFEQQMERLHGRTVAETKFPPMKVSSVKSMDEDGNVYDYATYAGVNPTTGVYGTWQIKSDKPVAYAPRAASGAAINAADEAKLRQAGMSTVLNNPTPEEIQKVNQVLPGARLIPTGYGSFYIASQTYRPVPYNGTVTAMPQTPETGNPAAGSQVLGQANSTLPTLRQESVAQPGGKRGTVTLESGKVLPGQSQPQSAAPPTPPPTGGIDLNQGPTPEAIQALVDANKSWKMTPDQAAIILQEQQAEAQKKKGQAAPPTAPPTSGLTNVPKVTTLPGAGPGLSAEQLMQTGQKAEAYQNTVERAVGLLQGFSDPNMRGILKRAKLHIVTSPDSGIKLVLGNLASLSPKEVKMASDFVSLSEDVNVLRSMYGATGFRSKEALAVLLGQRGELLENPQIFSGVLKNTLQSIVSQLEPIASQLADNGKPVTMTGPMATAYKYLNNNDAAVARQKALAAKYQMPQ